MDSREAAGTQNDLVDEVTADRGSKRRDKPSLSGKRYPRLTADADDIPQDSSIPETADRQEHIKKIVESIESRGFKKHVYFLLYGNYLPLTVEDVCQETFIAAEHAKFDGGSYKAWLKQIARNIVVNHIRDAHAKPCHRLSDDDEKTILEREGQQQESEEEQQAREKERQAREKEQQVILRAAMDEHPPCEAVTLRFRYGLSYKVIAQALDMKPKQAEMRFYRWKTKIKEYVNRR